MLIAICAWIKREKQQLNIKAEVPIIIMDE